ncbi:sensor histidine kinase [Streptomyces cahuitamycinicus]|uniref:histidine kinase n=1 Tax=Streptomyces cahuitamycinicus TaxID=2070367 RepID=A0A2N8TV92_9ACTN|nr:sensor histidine kinase [Streptomyces cahuitamycinicus]PNG22944.1 sensor histidine kinase [Streptomyces cahuitamycinicus]
MHPPTIWTRLHLRRYVRSGWPWRAALYLLSSAILGLITLLTLVLLAVAGSVLTVVVVGLPLLLVLVLTGVPLASVERRRLRLIDSEPLADPHREPDHTGLTAWLRTRLQERATWRELGYAVLFGFLLWPLEALVVGSVLLVCGGLLATPVMLAVDGEEARVLKMWIVDSRPGALGAALAGLLLLPVFSYPLGAIAAGRAALTRFLLASPTGELNSKIKELGRSRVRLVDAFEAERRRIERDLHDGAQQRLVALSMTLGLARLDAADGPLGPVLAKAQDEAATALVEIRELIRGIHPQVLTDRGLVAAVEDLADRSTIPVDVDLDLPVRPPEAIETAVYFAVSEALANVAKHSGASRAVVRGGLDEGQLAVEVEDDGHGGADTGRGTGLQGVADRVSVLDGRLQVSSPPGGPTVFRLLVPCSTA